MLEPESDKPLYLQLVDDLEATIRENLTAHDKIKSERELTDQYGVSRITVRLALQELETRGLVYRKKGKGTFVSELVDPIVDLSQVYSFTERMKKLGKVPKTLILSFASQKATSDLQKELRLDKEENVYVLERLRLADGVPMMVETSYLPEASFPDLTEELLESYPLYDIFDKTYKQSIKLAEEELYASLAEAEEAQLLEVAPQSPVLHLQRKSYNAKNKVIEYTLSVARADQFRYKISHQRQKKPLFGINFAKKK